MGYNLVGTAGTAEYYSKNGVGMLTLAKPPCEGPESVIAWIRQKKIDLVINIADGSTKSAVDEITAGYLMRRTAVDFGASLITNIKCAVMFVEALHRNKTLPCKSSEEYVGVPMVGWANDKNP